MRIRIFGVLITELNAGFGWSFPPTGNEPALSGTGRHYDRPTVGYNLMTGDTFARSPMAPIPPVSVMPTIKKRLSHRLGAQASGPFHSKK